MKLFIKLISLVLLGIIALLAIDGYYSVRRELMLLDEDSMRDGILIGHAMKPLVATTWRLGGEDQALTLIRRANRDESQIRVRWVWLGAQPADPFAPSVPAEELQGLEGDTERSIKMPDARGTQYRYTYVLVPVDDERAGALEMSESLAFIETYKRTAIIHMSILASAMLLLSWLLLWVFGVRFVGQPLNILMEKTRRVGAGDFSEPVVLTGRDELSRLADAMNRMCEQLESARAAVQRETEARIAALDQLRHTERLAVIGRLASGLAHELGTPLNVVSGRAKIIATEDLSREDVVSFSKTIADQVDRMTRIIRQLLDYARRPPSHRAPVDMPELAGQVLELLAPMARKANVALEFAKKTDIPRLNIDSSQIQQVLMNLALNGIQAMPGGGRLDIELDIERAAAPGIQATSEKDHVVIRVKDGGPGIPAEQRRLVFEPFFTTKEAGRGTGLGLSIASGIVDDHGGWIGVRNNPEGGGCFSVYLPIEARS
jgi:two-component system NtrC family sensor kinase